MKRNRRTIVAVLSALCLFLLPLSACGGTQTGGNSEEAQKRTPEEVIQDTIRKAQSFQSMSYSMDMEMDMKVEAQGISQTVDMTQTTQVECVVDPVQFKVDMTMDMGSLGKTSLWFTVSKMVLFSPCTHPQTVAKAIPNRNWT